MRRLLPPALGAVMLLGCGASVPSTLFAPDDLRVAPVASPVALTPAALPPEALPPEALGVPLPSPTLRALAPAATGPAHLEADDPRLYEVLVALEGPRAFVLGAEARADYQPWPTDDAPALAECPATACGTASLPVGAPPEAAYWLAIADLHWQGSDDGVHRGMLRTADSRGGPSEAESASVTRQIIRFTPAAGIDCAAQQKWFAAVAEPVKQAVDPVVTAEQQREGIVPVRLPAARSEAGRGQLLLRQRTRDDARFVVELHVALDHGALDHGALREAEVMDAVVVCESDAPIGPERLAAFGHQLARGDDGQWTMVVFAR